MHVSDLPLSPHPPGQRSGWLLVGAQACLLAASVLLRAGRDWPRPLALRVAAGLGQLVGLGVAAAAAGWLRDGLSALPYPNARAQLRTDGPFRLARHPIYSGSCSVAPRGPRRPATAGSCWSSGSCCGCSGSNP